MEFFVENWIWFLGAGILILMTLIGYLAEKTDFGRKDIPTKPKKKANAKVETEIEIEEEPKIESENEPEVQMSLATDAILEEPKEERIETLEPVAEDVPEELFVPFGDAATSFEDTNANANIEEFKVEELQPSVEEVISEEPTETLQVEDIDAPNIELPDLETIVTDEDEEDDVWKF